MDKLDPLTRDAADRIGRSVSPAAMRPEVVASCILERIRKHNRVWGPYPVDLCLDALLELHLAGGGEVFREYPLGILRRRGWHPGDPIPHAAQPFGHYQWHLLRATGDDRIAGEFITESRRFVAAVPRSHDGLVLHCDRAGAAAKVLVDSFQEYAVRTARCGFLARDASMLTDALEQIRRHRDLLRDPGHGCWSQGRGWEADDPGRLSPGAWSRGQGWVLRGLVEVAATLPDGGPAQAEIIAILGDLLGSLLRLQDEEGMWHVLPERDHAASAPETSGTALICWALYRAVASGWLPDGRHEAAAHRAFDAIARRVDADGVVHGACIGPGPLHRGLVGLYAGPRFDEAEDHGWFSVLYACAGRCAWERQAGLRP